MSEVSPLQEAQQSFLNSLSFASQDSERISLHEALGRVTASDITAPADMPPYHRAIVEGFLVRTEDTQEASEAKPVQFTVIGKVLPGDETCPEIGPFEAIEISTGSLVNDGNLSAVRPWEALKQNGDKFSIERPFPPRFFIEDRGCDQLSGSTLLTAGSKLGATEIGLIAAHGITGVECRRPPRVTLFSSGDEVIPFDQDVRPGQIRDSNALMLAVAVQEAGGIPVFGGIMHDNFDAFVATASKALDQSDMILISGGTAVGGRDFISDLVGALGTLIVDGVPMRSGRPLIMGHARGKPIVCVAGHPPEALRGFRLFGEPAMDRLQGLESSLPGDGD